MGLPGSGDMPCWVSGSGNVRGVKIVNLYSGCGASGRANWAQQKQIGGGKPTKLALQNKPAGTKVLVDIIWAFRNIHMYILFMKSIFELSSSIYLSNPHIF